MVAGSRRKARAYALQVMYARDVEGNTDVDAALAGWGDSFELDIDEPAQTFASELVTCAVTHLAEVDEIITSASKNWRLDRMSRVDRNILRLAACELKYFEQTPVKVAINEAVELAKRFGAAESPAFVNGILDRIAAAVGRTVEG